MLYALWRYRGFIYGMVVRDFKSRYMNSLLGSFWAVLNPLTQIFIYTLIFSQVMQAKLPGVADSLGYSIYLCAGILHWQLFHEVMWRSQGIFIEQGNLLKKVNFPRVALPIYSLISATVNYILIMTIFLLFLIGLGKFPGLILLALLPYLLMQQAIALGIGICLGSLNVFFRDVGHVLSIVLQFWFWLTPIVYPMEILPEAIAKIVQMNPMTLLMQSYQVIFLYQQLPDFSSILPLLTLSLVSMLIGYLVFTKLEKEMVDEL